jgi:hypothetical protein
VPSLADMSPEQKEGMRRKWLSVRERAAELAQRGAEHLAQEREEARARGDQAEVDRLDTALRERQAQVKRMREIQGEAPQQPPPEDEQPARPGPPLE